MPRQNREQNAPSAKEKVDALMNKLETGIQDFMQSGKYQEYLHTMSKFHNYSFRNCVLIAMQKPDATLVAGYSAWKEKFERQVGRGEKAIRILAPAPYEVTVDRVKKDDHGKTVYGADGKPVTETVKEKRMSFRSVSVFDVSQTDGKPLPEIAAELDGSVEDFELMLQAIRDTSDAPITIEKFSGSAKGYYDRTNHSIHIQEGMGEMQTVKTALHERAHSILHNDNVEDAAEKTRETKECEAESVAFVVCDHFGLDTGDYSFPYLASWSSGLDLPEIHASLETIQKTADNMISEIGARFAELKAERNASQTDSAVRSEKSETASTGHKPERSEKRSDRIGNTPYSEIPNKIYIRVDPAKTEALIKVLNQQKISFSGKLDPKKGDIITISAEHKPLVEKILSEGKALKDEFGESRYARCSAADVAALTKAGIPIQARKQADGSSIIKYNSADAETIKQTLSALNVARKKI